MYWIVSAEKEDRNSEKENEETNRPIEKDIQKEREKERGKEGGEQEKQGPTSLFRGGCCGINSVKSRRADRVSETERDRGGRGESS